MIEKPYVIALEGLDGSGKTVQAERLAKNLTLCGNHVLLLDFPQYQESFFGQAIGVLLSGKDGKFSAENLDGLSMALWYAADRRSTLDKYNLNDYDYVILNRYVYSNVAYQCAAEYGGYNEDLAEKIKAMEFVGFGLPVPDLNIFLRTSPALTAENVEKKGERTYTDGLDIYESSTSLLDNCREVYNELSKREKRFEVIDCMEESGEMRTESEIFADIFSALASWELISLAQ